MANDLVSIIMLSHNREKQKPERKTIRLLAEPKCHELCLKGRVCE